MKDKLKDEMLEAIFIQTGGREENQKIADLCTDIAIKFISSNGTLANRVSQCDVCGCHPSTIITTEFGTFCNAHAKYVR